MSDTSIAKKIGTRWFEEVWNLKKSDAIQHMLAKDAIGHLAGGDTIHGPDDFVKFQKSILEVLPDIQVTVLKTMVDGEDVAILWEASAHHTGNGLGLLATGKEVTFRGTTWFTVRDGLVIEGLDCWNQAKLMAELAASPT